MNIDKSIEHFEWRLKNHWKATAKDLEAYNAILEYKEIQERRNFKQNESLAKLFIEKMILLSRTGMYSGERCIQIIDEILNNDIYQYCLILKEEIPMMRFRSIGNDKYPMSDVNSLNLSKVRERNAIIIKENETELTEALKYEITEENIIKFVQNQIDRIIIKHEKAL